ncbi:MAG: cell division protein FtsK, partial [candidate division Zixibacteria bacterium]|nr:cell division protein FtsK [candidate division Zixibacteria bacterium]
AYLAPAWLTALAVWFWRPRAVTKSLKPALLYTFLAVVILALADNSGAYETLAHTADRSALYILESFGGMLSLQINHFALKLFGEFGSTLAFGALILIFLLLGLPRSVNVDSSGTPALLTLPKKIFGGIYSLLGGMRERRRRDAIERAELYVTEGADEEAGEETLREDRMRSALTIRRPAGFESPEAGRTGANRFLSAGEGQSQNEPVRHYRDQSRPAQASLPLGDYEFPNLDLLNDPPRRTRNDETAELKAIAVELRQTLATFGVKIDGEVIMIPGPVVTRYEFRPALGVKVNQILNLADDLALALRAKRIRIVAPIPGKAAVGIEVPIKKREIVFLKDIIKSRRYNSADIRLPLALGKGSAGEPFVADLAKMPHLLIAGATGSGKSVCINALIASLLYRLDPSELRFIFIDPKMLELSIYSGIPHLERPVVTNPRKAERVLADAVVEMEDRYKKLADSSVRNIVDYNEKITEPSKKLPYLVIVIDELADLMMSQTSARTELLLTRLAQMARAVGIHLILATQRPSVDVITGLIKANFPSRIAFHVATKVDSRTILDCNGAEKLLGLGDMLFQWAGQPELIRLHGAFISSEETENIVTKVRSQQVAVERIENVSKDVSDDGSDPAEPAEKVDPIYLEAIETVLHHRQASVSLLQRRLGIGYQRAARLIDRLEENGVVGPYDGSKARQILVDQSYLESLKAPKESSREQING